RDVWKLSPLPRGAGPGVSSEDGAHEGEEPDEGQERSDLGARLLLGQASVHEGDVASHDGQADTRPSGVREDRHREEAETDQRERDRERRHDGGLEVPILREERRTGNDDARGGDERRRAGADARGRTSELLDHLGDDVLLGLAGRHALVDRLVQLVERRDVLTEASAVEVSDATPGPPYQTARTGRLRGCTCHLSIIANARPPLLVMADWTTISSLATAGGTLVLAAATSSAVRSSNRSARIAERSLNVGMRPVLMSSRFQDAPEKVEWQDDHRAKIASGTAHVAEADGNVYLAASLRNVGAGIGVLQGWYPYGERLDASRPHPEPDAFRRQTRDLYIPPGDVGFWQGALRDSEDAAYFPVLSAIKDRLPLTVDLLYSDHEGGQRAISRLALIPRDEGDDSVWRCLVVRVWNLDRQDPR